jgi:hypothetical protein
MVPTISGATTEVFGGYPRLPHACKTLVMYHGGRPELSFHFMHHTISKGTFSASFMP